MATLFAVSFDEVLGVELEGTVFRSSVVFGVGSLRMLLCGVVPGSDGFAGGMFEPQVKLDGTVEKVETEEHKFVDPVLFLLLLLFCPVQLQWSLSPEIVKEERYSTLGDPTESSARWECDRCCMSGCKEEGMSCGSCLLGGDVCPDALAAKDSLLTVSPRASEPAKSVVNNLCVHQRRVEWTVARGGNTRTP